MTITITGYCGDNKSNCFLQLFNLSGDSRLNGIAKHPTPPAAKDMKLIFEDDFDGPLSLSPGGRGTRYTTRMPGDFSWMRNAPSAAFDETGVPFLQRDTWLRLRIDTNPKDAAAGLISSINDEGEGISVFLPCYFECRFVAHSAPGTRSSFRVMTTGVRKGAPADELVVMEARGGEGSGYSDTSGYAIALRKWNQDNATEPGGFGFHCPVYMRGLLGGGYSAAGWHETPHTYGVYVGKEFTVYYCDNIEVTRHRTTKRSTDSKLFFLISNTLDDDGSADLSQYGGISDMYVDFVRAYQSEK